MSDLTNLLAGRRTAAGGLGVHLGEITRLDPLSGGVYVTIARLAPGVEFGPCSAIDPPAPYMPGESVVVAPLETSVDEFVVLGHVQLAPPLP